MKAVSARGAGETTSGSTAASFGVSGAAMVAQATRQSIVIARGSAGASPGAGMSLQWPAIAVGDAWCGIAIAWAAAIRPNGATSKASSISAEMSRRRCTLA